MSTDPYELVLSKLEGVRRTGKDKVIAKCPSHLDRTPSLAVGRVGDGRVLLTCFAGCDVNEIVSALGLSLADLFPRDSNTQMHRVKATNWVRAIDALIACDFSMLVALDISKRILDGKPITSDDREALLVAMSRLTTALGVVCNG
jgi:hypothetical protein